jgi:hypothetical protein
MTSTPNDWARALAVRVFWVGNDIRINSSQLTCIVDKSKSSVKEAISLMRYTPVIMKTEGLNILIRAIPLLPE